MGTSMIISGCWYLNTFIDLNSVFRLWKIRIRESVPPQRRMRPLAQQTKTSLFLTFVAVDPAHPSFLATVRKEQTVTNIFQQLRLAWLFSLKTDSNTNTWTGFDFGSLWSLEILLTRLGWPWTCLPWDRSSTHTDRIPSRQSGATAGAPWASLN